MGKNKDKWTAKVEVITRKKFPPKGEAGAAVFWPSPGFYEKKNFSSRFSTEGALIYTSAVPHSGNKAKVSDHIDPILQNN